MSDAGEQTNWDDLFRQQIPDALRLAIRLTGNTHDAEDVVQESFLRAARGKDSFRGECSLRTWISRIVVNVFRTWITKRPRCESLMEDPAENTQTHEHRTEQTERAELVARHVSRLPERQREVIVFCVYENMAASDVADLLGISVQNVYSNLSAAQRQLRESLSPFLKSGAKS